MTYNILVIYNYFNLYIVIASSCNSFPGALSIFIFHHCFLYIVIALQLISAKAWILVVYDFYSVLLFLLLSLFHLIQNLFITLNRKLLISSLSPCKMNKEGSIKKRNKELSPKKIKSDNFMGSNSWKSNIAMAP